MAKAAGFDFTMEELSLAREEEAAFSVAGGSCCGYECESENSGCGGDILRMRYLH